MWKKYILFFIISCLHQPHMGHMPNFDENFALVSDVALHGRLLMNPSFHRSLPMIVYTQIKGLNPYHQFPKPPTRPSPRIVPHSSPTRPWGLSNDSRPCIYPEPKRKKGADCLCRNPGDLGRLKVNIKEHYTGIWCVYREPSVACLIILVHDVCSPPFSIVVVRVRVKCVPLYQMASRCPSGW
ncbi:hypothetical protein QBC35DRAFT_252524 [Podospora australis]|uniref:Secreted protein n=1 Tax=Podospora australis TaxID=1536484 RepID=A0AAN6WUW3_9PEZI|nr:hypothetical protein QBC35DRAFT_252524 [Podospora australis]